MLYARVLYRTLYVYPTGQFRRRSVLWLATSPEQVARARRRPLRLVGDAAQRRAAALLPRAAASDPRRPAYRAHTAQAHKRAMAATNAAIQNSMQQLAATTRGSA